MIKNILIGLLIVLSIPFAKAEPIFATCITEFPTTSYMIKTEKDQVIVRIVMHGGPQFGPFWQGIVVPNDLKILTEYATEFVKLNDVNDITWKTNQCTWSDDNFYCSGQTEKVKSGSQIIDPWAVYSSRLYEKNFSGKYEYIQLNFMFSMNGINYNIPMKYSSSECWIDKKPLLKIKKAASTKTKN